MMNEHKADALYMIHALTIWGGSIWQICHVFSNKSAEDITLVWMICLFISELVALPRCLKSKYLVWKLCHCVASVLIGILLIGIILYG